MSSQGSVELERLRMCRTDAGYVSGLFAEASIGVSAQDVLLEREALEERDALTMRKMRDLVARFVVDADGEAVEEEAARSLVGRMTMTQLVETMDEMGGSFETMKDEAVSGEASGS